MQDDTTISHASRNNKVDDGVPCPECQTDRWTQGAVVDVAEYRCLDCGAFFDN